MSQSLACQLTENTFRMLKTMLTGSHAEDAFYRLLRTKLSAAEIVSSEALSPTVATINSRIELSADGGRVENRVLVRTAKVFGLHLPITTLRGLAVLGLRAGETIEIEKPDGTHEKITLVRVCYQPEAQRRSALRQSREAGLHIPV